jgi:hypothetical protein
VKLANCVKKFARTVVNGWDGTQWVPDVCRVDFLPSSRFISKHEFDTKVQYVFTQHDSTALEEYDVVQVENTGHIWLVGRETYDVSGNPYSKFYVFRRAESEGDLISFTKNIAASGTAKSLNRVVESHIFCDVERVTSTGSKVFTNTKFPDVVIYLPRSVELLTSHEIKIENKYYDVKESFNNNGLTACRALAKSSA